MSLGQVCDRAAAVLDTYVILGEGKLENQTFVGDFRKKWCKWLEVGESRG